MPNSSARKDHECKHNLIKTKPPEHTLPEKALKTKDPSNVGVSKHIQEQESTNQTQFKASNTKTNTQKVIKKGNFHKATDSRGKEKTKRV